MVVDTQMITSESNALISVHTPINQSMVVTNIIDKEGFVVEIYEEYDKDIEFDWFIIEGL